MLITLFVFSDCLTVWYGVCLDGAAQETRDNIISPQQHKRTTRRTKGFGNKLSDPLCTVPGYYSVHCFQQQPTNFPSV
jgi:hypothetical protein